MYIVIYLGVFMFINMGFTTIFITCLYYYLLNILITFNIFNVTLRYQHGSENLQFLKHGLNFKLDITRLSTGWSKKDRNRITAFLLPKPRE